MSTEYVHALEVILGVTFTIMLSLVTYWVKRVEKETDRTLTRMGFVEARLSEYKEKHAVGETELKAIRELLSAHVEREENVTWKRIDAIDKENQVAHQKLFETLATLHGDVRELVGIMSTKFGNGSRTTREVKGR